MAGNLTGLFHVAIKTSDLDKTVRFYRDVIGCHESPRPPLGFPGAWLAVPTPVGEALFHIYAGEPAKDADGGPTPHGTGAIDHVSLTAVGFQEMRNRIKAAGLPWREAIVPGTPLWQLFVFDPSGVQLEIIFDKRAEQGPEPDDSTPGVRYRPNEDYFDPAAYARL
jgi:catechol 2,3-dioxygenase-like lactoylglutathione lyase family enzyme